MKIAALQTVSGLDVERNLEHARALMTRAAERGAELVCLPEHFYQIARHDTDKLAIREHEGDGPIQRFLAEAARSLQLWVIGGTLPMQAGDEQHVRNTSLVYGPDGAQVARYDKIHLFRYDSGRERYDEARVLEAGAQPVTFAARAGDGSSVRVGLSVCYDLRFPELYRALMDPELGGPCDLLVVPSAFTYTTGRAHWEVLLRARAIENQCYVMAPAQGGEHESGRRTWGHSMIVDPWGEILALREEGEGIVLAELSAERLAQVRQQLPALEHRVL